MKGKGCLPRQLFLFDENFRIYIAIKNHCVLYFL